MSEKQKDVKDAPIEELEARLLWLQNEMDMLDTMNNSLEYPSLHEGGGDDHHQQRWQELNNEAAMINTEINRRHMLEFID